MLIYKDNLFLFVFVYTVVFLQLVLICPVMLESMVIHSAYVAWGICSFQSSSIALFVVVCMCVSVCVCLLQIGQQALMFTLNNIDFIPTQHFNASECTQLLPFHWCVPDTVWSGCSAHTAIARFPFLVH